MLSGDKARATARTDRRAAENPWREVFDDQNSMIDRLLFKCWSTFDDLLVMQFGMSPCLRFSDDNGVNKIFPHLHLIHHAPPTVHATCDCSSKSMGSICNVPYRVYLLFPIMCRIAK